MDQHVALLEKHFGNSPYLRLLPLSEDRLDLSQLELLDPQLPAEWLQHLLKRESAERILELPETEAESQAERLDALQAQLESLYEQQLQLQETQGSQALYLGYPLLQFPASADGRNLSAPLYLWPLQLERSAEETRQWRLEYKGAHPPKLNPVLQRYLKARSDFDLLALQVSLLGQAPLDTEALAKISNKMIAQMGLEGQAQLALKQVEPLQDQWTALHWNAVLTLFPSDNFEILEQAAPVVPQSSPAVVEHDWKQGFSGLLFNHEQEAALRQLQGKQHLRLEGASQSGKTHFAIGSSLSLLGDLAQALVVAPQSKDFEPWQAQLEKHGLGNLVLRLEDEQSDKLALLERLLELPKQLKKRPAFDEAGYKIRLSAYRQLIERMDAAQEALGQSPFRGEDWPSAVGAFLHFHQQAGKQLLSRLLDEKRYSWSVDEYEQLMLCLQQHEGLYKKLNTLQHPFLALEDAFMSGETFAVVQQQVQQHFQHYGNRLQDLYFGLLSFSENLKDELRFEYEDFTLQMRQHIKRLRQHIRHSILRYGSDYEATGTLNKAKLRITGIFSKRSRAVLEAKEEQRERYEALLDYYEEKRFFHADLPAYRKGWTPQDIEQLLQKLETQLKAWQNEAEQRVEKRLRNLNPNAAFIRPELRHQLEQLEQDWQQFAEQVGRDGIWRKSISQRFELIADQERYMGQLQEELQQLQRRLPELEAYYHWRRDWLMMSELEHDLIEALVQLKPPSWEKTFRSWYLYHLLSSYYSLDLPQDELNVERLSQLGEELRSFLVQKIQCEYQNLQQEHLKRLRAENRLVYDQLFKKSAQSQISGMRIEDIIALQPQLFRHLFPLQLMSPAMAKRCWTPHPQSFALLVLENAEQLDETATAPLLGIGQQRLLLGKERPGAPSSSLWMESLKDDKYEKQVLQQRYLEQPEIGEADKAVQPVPPSAFAKELQRALSGFIDDSRIEFLTDHPLGIHLIVHPLHTKAAPIAIVCDGFLNQLPPYAYERASMQSEAIGTQNYVLRLEWSAQWWRNYERAKRRLVAFILNWDKDFE